MFSFCFSYNEFLKKLQCFRSSRSQMLKIGVLKNFVVFTGKHLCWSLIPIKLQNWRPATLLKRDLTQRHFPVNITKFLRTVFSNEHLRWLFLLFLTINQHKQFCLFSIFFKKQTEVCNFTDHTLDYHETVSGKMPPGKKSPGKMPPRKLPPGILPPPRK